MRIFCSQSVICERSNADWGQKVCSRNPKSIVKLRWPFRRDVKILVTFSMGCYMGLKWKTQFCFILKNVFFSSNQEFSFVLNLQYECKLIDLEQKFLIPIGFSQYQKIVELTLCLHGMQILEDFLFLQKIWYCIVVRTII